MENTEKNMESLIFWTVNHSMYSFQERLTTLDGQNTYHIFCSFDENDFFEAQKKHKGAYKAIRRDAGDKKILSGDLGNDFVILSNFRAIPAWELVLYLDVITEKIKYMVYKDEFSQSKAAYSQMLKRNRGVLFGY